MNKTIVLAGDRNYTRQLETTIKSILYHNRDVKIYILNQDIMPDWFRKPRKIARMLGSEIIYVKLPEQTVFQDWEKQDHISSITYARYFIADYIQEDKVLYLDSDLIVNTSLEKLFSICLEEKSLAAVKDTDGITFNTGVLLINNKKWRQEKLKERLIEQSIVTMKEVEEGRFEHFNGDQTIFNQVLQDDWSEIAFQRSDLNYFERSNQSKKQVMLVTWSADIKHLEYLVQRLPDWHFHLAAPCDCSEELTSLSQYTNVTVYQNVLHSRIDWLLDDSIVYLDINTGGEVFNVVTRAQESGKKIFAFDITRKSMDDGLYDGIFSVERPDDLVDRMKNIEIE